MFTDKGLTGVGEAANWPGSPMVLSPCEHVANATEAQKRIDLDRLAVVSEALGLDFPIAVETHALLNGPTAVEMALGFLYIKSRRSHYAGHGTNDAQSMPR